jgi:hypothetical protein
MTTLITDEIRRQLRANAVIHEMHARRSWPEPDHRPVVKFFNPVGAATWLATELDRDGDTLFGLADLGFGCPELGSFSLFEIGLVRLPFGLRIARDVDFRTAHPLSLWADTARRCGSIIGAQGALADRPPPFAS